MIVLVERNLICRLEGDEMFDFLKKFKKECVNTCEQLEKAELENENQVKAEKPIAAVIDGFLYDTSKADKICEYFVENEDMAASGMTFGLIKAILFRTKNGRFFIQQIGRIYPCDDKLAKKILSYQPDKYQEIFGKVEKA